MTSLPIVERELGIASRKIGSWLSRWIIAIAAVLFGGGWLLIASLGGGMMKGDIFFAILAWACFAYCLLAGLWTTTGTLTREKTDGTLGLLFLTDLRGYDVVLGKMITASLKSFYGVLAVLPVLALPLLMGGVTNDQLWRTIGALLNILIFSLSLGMFFSALSWHTGRAIFWTFFSLLSVTMLPLFYLWSGGVSSFLHFLSPGFAMANASAPVIGAPVAGFVGYWSWLGGGLAVSAALLALASWIIPYRWRETKLREQPPRLAKRPTGDASRPSAVQQAALLDANPAGWLVWRMRTFRVSRRLLMFLMITVGALLLGYMALVGALVGDIWWMMGSLIWVASFWIRLEVARHAVTTIYEAKASGALEQILVTPIDERHFRRGHFAAMVRFWMWPVIVLASLPLAAILLSIVSAGWGSNEALIGFSIMGMIAKNLNKPVKWIESRQENFIATTHGRDHIADAEICGNRDGTISGFKVHVYANLGAYLSTFAPGIPTILYGLLLSGVYKVPHISCVVTGVFTNTTPVDAYRGAGRPEATFVLERLVDMFAAEIGRDPVAVRRKNFLPTFKNGRTVSAGVVYDSGDYRATLIKLEESQAGGFQ
jgi:hypothetical protein